MTTRLDPTRPLLWRTPHSLQIGVDDAVVLDSVWTGAEQIVAALRVGFPAPVEERLATAFSIPEAEFERVMTALDPVIERDEQPSTILARVTPKRVVIDGDGPLADRLYELLRDQAAVQLLPAKEVSDGGRPVDLAVLCGDFVLPPSRYARWLRDDVAHLPIVLGDRSIRVGPFVTPGDGPCLHCLDLHRTDEDPAWPAVASQLLGLRSPLDTALLSTETAARAVRLVLRRIAAERAVLAGTQLVVDAATGGIRRRVVREHSRCACRALPGNETAPGARPVAAPPPTTGSTGAWRE